MYHQGSELRNGFVSVVSVFGDKQIKDHVFAFLPFHSIFIVNDKLYCWMLLMFDMLNSSDAFNMLFLFNQIFSSKTFFTEAKLSKGKCMLAMLLPATLEAATLFD